MDVDVTIETRKEIRENEIERRKIIEGNNEGKNKRNKKRNFHFERNPNKEEDRKERKKENGRAQCVFSVNLSSLSQRKSVS